MGYGDFKLMAVFGAWVGWEPLALVLLLSAAAGTVVGLTLMAMRRMSRDTPMPFGPFIIIAGWLTILFKAPLQTVVYGILIWP